MLDGGVGGSNLVAALRYRDPTNAVNWLCDALGFSRRTVTAGEDGSVLYAELTLGSGMMMVGRVDDTELDKFMRQPDEIGGAETQICYFAVPDIAGHLARARDAGAEIVIDLRDYGLHSVAYTCRDPEGHLWTFGNYDHWRGRALAADESIEVETGANRAIPVSDAPGPGAFLQANHESRPAGDNLTRTIRSIVETRPRTASVIALAAAALAIAGWFVFMVPANNASPEATIEANALQARLRRETGARILAARALADASAELAQVKKTRHAAEVELEGARAQIRAMEAAKRDASEPRTQVKQDRKEIEAAERAATDAQGQLTQERSARQAAERVAEKAREDITVAKRTATVAVRRLMQQRYARARAELAVEKARKDAEGAERATIEARDKLAQERSAREAAERAAAEARKAPVETAGIKAPRNVSTSATTDRASEDARKALSAERASKQAAWRITRELARTNRQVKRRLAQLLVKRKPSSAAPKKRAVEKVRPPASIPQNETAERPTAVRPHPEIPNND